MKTNEEINGKMTEDNCGFDLEQRKRGIRVMCLQSEIFMLWERQKMIYKKQPKIECYAAFGDMIKLTMGKTPEKFVIMGGMEHDGQYVRGEIDYNDWYNIESNNRFNANNEKRRQPWL